VQSASEGQHQKGSLHPWKVSQDYRKKKGKCKEEKKVILLFMTS